jgi:ABC-type transport system involved in multi-copper enzyme maturation permease subunit
VSGVWTIARHTIAEGLRMKIAVVFLVLIGLVVLGLPFSVSGDRSLTGAVQTFLSYSMSATTILLGLLTVFLSRSLATDLVNRQIFLVLTKPIPRWQYVLGKWMGITLLNAAFLFTSALTTYLMVHYIRHARPPIDPTFDPAELTNEVLVARHALRAKLPDFRKPAEEEFERNREEGLYDNRPAFDPEAIKASLTSKYEARWRVVGPMAGRVFEFENILCDRSPDSYVQLRYKTDVSRYPPDEVFRAAWRFGDPTKGTAVYEHHVRHAVGRYHTISVRADAVAEDHTLLAYFYNRNPYQGEPQYPSVMEFRKSEPVELLFVVGTFGWNLVRLSCLILCKLSFLAAVAVLATTVFSYPVAALTALTIYVLAGTRAFIVEALDLASDDFVSMFKSVKEFMVQSFSYVYDALFWVIPDFARYDAVEEFVSGRNVSLVWVLDAVFWVLLVRTGVVLAMAVLAFQRRELAEVSV